MARFIIQNKVYDTKKMQYIGRVEKWYASRGWGGVYDCALYCSSKGNFLLVHNDGAKRVGDAIPESEAKELLLHCNYEKYVEMYGPIEEA